jgi:hypothetical protein
MYEFDDELGRDDGVGLSWAASDLETMNEE